MKMPRFAELDEEQRRIYQGAPPDGSVLVVGPPGTGKTVMAFHRATYLKKLGQDPRVIMFNSVLSEYVRANNTHAKDVPVSTMHKWVSEWFHRMRLTLPRAPERYAHDWPAIAKRVHERMTAGGSTAGHWGHLIVDEGQDFPKEMYTALALLLHHQGRDGRAPAALSVFADENQRLTNTNSTIAQIRSALALAGNGRVFSLTRNYRNTGPIAKFCAHFYCGLQTGIPDPPTKKGKRPVVSFHRNQPAMVQGIIDFIEEARDLEWDVGIICPRDRTRRYIYAQLCDRYAHDDDLVIQSFSSKDKELRADNLQFDCTNTVTVLCRESVKGLEFDAVIVVDPFLRSDAEGGSEQQFKMNMYVSCSRARTFLKLMFVHEVPKVMKVLPPGSAQLFDVVEE